MWFLAALVLLPCAAVSQPFYFGNENPRESTAILATYSAVDFSFDGNTAPETVLNFSAPTYGLAFSRGNVYASFAWGQDQIMDSLQTDLSLLDFSLYAWAEVFFSEKARTADHRIFAPIMLFTNYRKVTPDNGGFLQEFNVTTLGLGLGLGYYGALGENVLIELRSTPALGYAAQSFGESSGIARMIDTDIQVHIGSVLKRFGISIGYAYRIQIWDLKATINPGNILGNLSSDLYDYRDTRHSVSLGVNW